MMANFGFAIAQRRAIKGLTLKDVGGMIGVSDSYLSLIERGLMPPPADAKLEALGEVLGYKPEEIYVLAGRLPHEYRRYVQQNTRKVLTSLKRMRKREANCR